MALMRTGLYKSEFSKAFDELLRKTGVTCYQISQYADIDEGYLSRLRCGERSNPSVEIIIKIGFAFTHLSNLGNKSIKVTIDDIERLLNSVGRTLKFR